MDRCSKDWWWCGTRWVRQCLEEGFAVAMMLGTFPRCWSLFEALGPTARPRSDWPVGVEDEKGRAGSSLFRSKTTINDVKQISTLPCCECYIIFIRILFKRCILKFRFP